MPAPTPSRRDFLWTTGTAVGGAWMTANLPALGPIRAWAAEAAAADERPALEFLTAEEAEAIESVSARIVPTDDRPGAREAGVVFFADRTLGTILAELGEFFRVAYPEFVEALRRRHPDAGSFADLTGAQQDDLLREIEQGAFFQIVRLITVFGMFSDPIHGGNRDGVGWELVGFENRHMWAPPFGYYDRGHHGEGE